MRCAGNTTTTTTKIITIESDWPSFYTLFSTNSFHKWRGMNEFVMPGYGDNWDNAKMQSFNKGRVCCVHLYFSFNDFLVPWIRNGAECEKCIAFRQWQIDNWLSTFCNTHTHNLALTRINGISLKNRRWIQMKYFNAIFTYSFVIPHYIFHAMPCYVH